MEQTEKLKKLHQVELELLDELHRICTAHGLTYFLDSGTALGAVRHKGFIPWDDDMDVGMPRADYDRFIELAGTELKPAFFLQTHDTEPNSYKFYAKLRKEGTYYPSRISARYRHQGIAIDIFPFDAASPDRAEALKMLNRSRKLYRLIRAHACWRWSKSSRKRIAGRLMRIIPERLLRNRYDRLCRRYNTRESDVLVCYPYKMTQKKDLFFRKADMLPTQPAVFEDRVYRIMHDPDRYLTTMYGDYMKLPPENERRVKIGVISFGEAEEKS